MAFAGKGRVKHAADASAISWIKHSAAFFSILQWSRIRNDDGRL